MTRLNTTTFLLAFILSLILNATLLGQSGVGDYKSGFKQIDNTFEFSNSNADVVIEFCTPTIFRVRTTWTGQFVDNEDLMVIHYDWPTVDIEHKEDKQSFTLKTNQLTLKIRKTPFLIDVYDADGVLINSESGIKNGGGQSHGSTVLSKKNLGSDEHFFGFGERMDFIDQRNKHVQLNVGRGKGRPHIIGAYNVLKANYCPVPFFMSTKGYGIFLHNSFANEWDMGNSDQNSYQFKAANGELDYYFIYGPDFPSILNGYTSITGKAPMLPKFALGLHVGTYSGGTWGHEEMTSTEYVVNLVRKFRTLGIPIDILHLDSTWRIFGKNGGKGATTFEWRETFDDPKAMFDSLYAMHINLAGVHLRPRFDNGNQLDLLDQARKLGYVYPENNSPGEFVNFFDEQAVDWWWEEGVMRVAEIGARFLKTDEGSAFGHEANESSKVGPTGIEAERLHNVFPIAYAKAPYEKFQNFNGIRGMNHTREGYAGIQRYPFIFAGDWPSEWQYFGPVIKAGINIGLSGVGNWTHCMGGFEHNADPELYTRWCQFGLLSPISHLFGMDHPGYKEPWNYGEEALANFKKYTLFRYRLIPYLYSTSYEMHMTGMPMMRALVIENQEDANTYNIDDQYMLGKYLMICPVTSKEAKTRVIYLPKGNWYDYYTGEKYEGKQFVQVLTPLDHIPILAKAGAIIPMQKAMQYVGEEEVYELTLQIFPDGLSAYTLYDDDGLSLEYLSGSFAQTQISCDATSENSITIQIKQPNGNFQVKTRTYNLQIHGKRMPEQVFINNRRIEKNTELNAATIGWYFDTEKNTTQIVTGQKSGNDISVKVTYN